MVRGTDVAGLEPAHMGLRESINGILPSSGVNDVTVGV